jgi:uncharacterized protein (TIGR03083 family)
MTSFAETASLALHELEGCRSVLARTAGDRWQQPTPCEGWDVTALGRHVAAVAWQQAEAFHRATVGVTEAPSWLEARGDIVRTVGQSTAHLERAITAIDEEANVPLPFGLLPAPIAMSALVLEYGVHRSDLERAVDGTPEAHLDPDVARVVAGLVPLLMPLLATDPPPNPLTYRLVGDTVTAAITSEGGAWRTGDGAQTVCELRGSDAAISLLALGRIGPDHPSLDVVDPAGAAPSFSTHVRRL